MSILTASGPTSVAIGNFDGMHLGHAALFERLTPEGGIVVIEHYRAALTPGVYRGRFVNLPLYFYDLARIRDLSARAFVEMLTVHFPRLRRIVVGEDFRFGAGREADAATLERLFDGEVVALAEVKLQGRGIHSRHIRTAVEKGELQEAAAMLGRFYTIVGEVEPGQGIGRQRLVPTLNLNTGRFLLPPAGVYRSETEVEGKFYPSVTFIGHRLSTDGRFAVETHLIDRNLTHAPLRVGLRLKKRLRENRRFESLEALKRQIMKDIDDARA